MDRRTFLRSGVKKAAEAAHQIAEESLASRALRWIRPPFALTEIDFLITCTRCDACIEACPHKVVFPLSTRLGPSVAGTPALDLLHRGCHMCEDWPCVTACEPGALALPEGEKTPPPTLARAAIDSKTCLPYSGPECGACAHACPVPNALQWIGGVKPVIDAEHCTGCGMCREACIVSPKAITIASLASEER